MIYIYILMLIIVLVLDYWLVNNTINNHDDKIKLWFKKLLKK
jgi:hypothetical protein